MNVLSLFDGMSCGQQALKKQNFKINNYFASEVDKYAIEVTMKNFPNTIQIGDVRNINTKDLPKIDLLIGGSPCQSFSFAGKRKGMSTKFEEEILTLEQYLYLKNEGFEFEGQSYLFWEFVRILKETKPKYFLLENVLMVEKWEKIISKTLEVNPIQINSALVSAQNRKRLYWTNIGLKPSGLFGDLESIIEEPKDKYILIKDILQNKVDLKYFLSEKMINYLKIKLSNDYIIHSTFGRTSTKGTGGSGHLSRNDGKTYCLDTANSMAVELNKSIRKLTPIECERLQCVEDNYTNFVSDTQRYKMLGNGWTIDVIAHILKYIKQ
jgi:DNA (cytosine-5)-methyltransferase 3A